MVITGIFMRVKRDDKWQSLDLAEMTDTELHQAFASADKERVMMFLVGVIAWIRDHAQVEPSESEEQQL